MKKLSDAIDRFCYLHPRFGIPDLMKYIVFGNAVVYLLAQFNLSGWNAVSFLAFSWDGIRAGELWRLVTFVFVPSTSRLFFLFMELYFAYLVGSTLERAWGTAKFTFYYLLGLALTAVGAILVSLITGSSVELYGADYLNLSLFFAFAMLYPDLQLLLFFLIPIKAKWLALADAVWFVAGIVWSLSIGYVAGWLTPLIAIANFLIFFAGDLSRFVGQQRRRSGAKTVHFKAAVRNQDRQTRQQGYRHKCEVCGRTDTDYPNLQFRYCSRCVGYHCFCEDHIFHHEHFTE